MMSYDPSSLNRNKTLLEAIEEVKKFLIANPCYKVFYANTNYLVGTTTYSKTYIDDPDSMAEYDVVFFDNNYYGKVESVGDSTFTIIGATNFKGDTGTPGTPGADGQDGADGISITNVSINASNHLICTLSNGTTIDAGEIPGGSTRIISLASGLSGTLTQDEYDKLVANDFNYVIEMGGNFYHKASLYGGGLNAHYTCIRKVSSVETWASDINIDSTRAWTLSTNVLRTKIQNAQIDSGAATSGQVLTADGTGGAAWQTPSGGFDNYVEINTTSGTFTDDEYAKLLFNDSVIVYDNGSYKTIYKKKIDTSSIIEFESIDASARQNLKLIDVNKGTKAFSSTGISMITSSTFDSGSATAGKVLTANGSGGTSWETAGGGGSIKVSNIDSETSIDYQFIGSNGDGTASWKNPMGQYHENGLSSTTDKSRIIKLLTSCRYANITMTPAGGEILPGMYAYTSQAMRLGLTFSGYDNVNSKYKIYNIVYNISTDTFVSGRIIEIDNTGTITSTAMSNSTNFTINIKYFNYKEIE